MAKIVLKVGSNLLVKEDAIDKTYVMKLVSLVDELMGSGHQVAIVSSGAAASGRALLAFKGHSKSLLSKQALCAIGQPKLMEIYQQAFSFYNRQVAQILLTRDDFNNRQRFLNLRNTLIGLSELGIVPIVNENDTISVDEIKFGDNDVLSAMFSICWGADYLFLMTSVDGVIGEDGTVIENYPIDIQNVKIAELGKTSFGSGGIFSKIVAAKIAVESDVDSYVINGRNLECVKKILRRAKCGTRFVTSKQRRLSKRESWVKYISKPKGTVYINEGARTALLNRKSLLPVGVVDVEGKFEKGDVVLLAHGEEILGRGITNYSADEIQRIKGLRTSEIPEEIYTYDEVVHADNVILEIKTL
ncbi:glutamate 5-kinase [Fervidobacterium islandicum]|uniref:Glutamate 5-kinase n=1 Tax=Fervidobacterium islandicum TaxID=2423 RepID=A0AAI8CN93_FERIS|nr:glutamate 5-kinase [Fervidobacterium islandicum]AMW33538.1 glutamate 5-kinase [Fervidobacterium islandicum]